MPDTHPTGVTRRGDYRPPSHLVDTVDLHFTLDHAATIVRSRLSVRRNPAGTDPAEPLHLDGEALELLSIRLDGETLGTNRYARQPDGSLVIHHLPDHAVLEIETRIAPAANTELSGLYTSGGAFFTQCEAQGFRRITFFPDRPDVMARFTTTIEADSAAAPVLLSNGNPDAAGTLPDGSIRTPSPPISLRWSPAIWWRCATASPRDPAATWRSPSGYAAETRIAAATPCAR
jgi:aminopeptidase N